MLQDGVYLNSSQLMDQILNALRNNSPLSVVSVGATETFVMTQYTILTEEEFMNHDEARVANFGMESGLGGGDSGFYHRGVRFPNIQTRDDVVDAVRKADIVGYNTFITWDDANTGRMTERVFEAYGIRPKYLFDSYLRRVIMFSQKDKFEEMLAGRNILLVGAPAEQARDALNRNLKLRLGFQIVGTVPIDNYDELPVTKKQIGEYDFDLCLLAAGTNAVILSSYISTQLGKVAFDIGSGMKSLYTGEVYTDPWLDLCIGLENLINM